MRDGEPASAGRTLCAIRGNARAVLSAERCALNFLQSLSGTATTTAKHVAAVRGTRAIILDTRKTIPGLRLAQKYAVRCGGGQNHRIGLFDAILIKENHIAAAGSLTAAVRSARAQNPNLFLEVEVENFAELEEALATGAVDRIMRLIRGSHGLRLRRDYRFDFSVDGRDRHRGTLSLVAGELQTHSLPIVDAFANEALGNVVRFPVRPSLEKH